VSVDEPYGAVVLAGGRGRRVGGPGKPTLPVGGRPMVHRVLDAVADAEPRIVVGPPELPLPAGVDRTLEQPPGGGPVAATAAALVLVPSRTRVVALLAADLPFLTRASLHLLRRRLAGDAGAAGAVYVDDAGRPQWLCGVWRVAALRARLAALPHGPARVSLRELLHEAPVAHCSLGPGGADGGDAPPPWWDCDTEADLRRAQEIWVSGRKGQS